MFPHDVVEDAFAFEGTLIFEIPSVLDVVASAALTPVHVI